MTYDDFDDKFKEETVCLTFDFSGGLGVAETLTGTPIVTVAILNGARGTILTLGTVAVSVDGKSVLVFVSGGVAGVRYLVRASCATTSSPRVLAWAGAILVK